MIFTDRFIYLHMPKTGGSFVTKMLIQLHCPRPSRVRRLLNLTRWRRYPGPYGVLIDDANKHGIRSEVPDGQRSKPVLGTIRNPFDRFVSLYEYGWWRRPEWLQDYRRLPDFERRFPTFPDLSFEAYVCLESEAYGDITPERFHDPQAIGLQTQDFVRQYCPDPHRVLERIQSGGSSAVDWRAELGACHFLRTSRLNEELHRFLVDVGYPPDSVEFVKRHEKVLPGKGRTSEQVWEKYYTPTLKQIVRQQDRALFELFPEFDV